MSNSATVMLFGYSALWFPPTGCKLQKNYVIHSLIWLILNSLTCTTLLKGFALLYFLIFFHFYLLILLRLSDTKKSSAICHIIILLSKVDFTSPNSFTWGSLFLFHLSVICYRSLGLVSKAELAWGETFPYF